MYPKSNFSNKELNLSFLRELTGKNKTSNKRKITNESKSDEISDIISEKLLRNVKKQLSI